VTSGLCGPDFRRDLPVERLEPVSSCCGKRESVLIDAIAVLVIVLMLADITRMLFTDD